MCAQQLIAALNEMLTADTLALFIALLALAVTFWQGYVTRRHNRLSVKPHLYFETKAASGEAMGLRLTNGGLGPAIIKSISLSIDGQEIENPNLATVRKALEKIAPKIKINLSWYDPEQILKSGDSDYILWLPAEQRKPDSEHALEEMVKRMALVIKYSSVYNEKFVVSRISGRGLLAKD